MERISIKYLSRKAWMFVQKILLTLIKLAQPFIIYEHLPLAVLLITFFVPLLPWFYSLTTTGLDFVFGSFFFLGAKSKFVVFLLLIYGVWIMLRRSNQFSSKMAQDGGRKQTALDEQAQSTRQTGTWQSMALAADRKGIMQLVEINENVINERGSVGDSLPLLLGLFNGEAHISILKELVTRYPHLIKDKYTKGESNLYTGENLLHIAIVNQNMEMVRWLTQLYPQLVLDQAVGSFFATGSPCYYGEFALSFAAATNQAHIFDFLLEHGAKIDARDSTGNTCLHIAVLLQYKDMYMHIIKRALERDVQMERIENVGGLTVLNYAAFHGFPEMFEFILESQRIKQWSYGCITCYLYPLKEIDWARGKSMGAVEWIVDKGHKNMLKGHRITRLLQTKWDTFANRIFMRRFLVSAISLIFFTIFLMMDVRLGEDDFWYALRYAVLETTLLSGASYKLAIEMRELANEGLSVYLSPRAIIENICSCMTCAFLIIAWVSRHTSNFFQQELLGLASLFGWAYMLWFLLGFRITGPFVIMIFRMLHDDIMPFSIVMLIFLLGYSQAFYVIHVENGDAGKYFGILKLCFAAMMGDLSMDDFGSDGHPMLSLFLVICFIVTSIMLINLLIAMMGHTFDRINDEAEAQWLLQRAGIIFSIEQNMDTEELEQNKYWVTVNGDRFLQVEEKDESHFGTFQLEATT